MTQYQNQQSGNEKTSGHLSAGTFQLEGEIFMILAFN